MCLFAKKYRMALKVKLSVWGKTSILGHVKHKSGLPTQSLQSLHRLDADFGSPWNWDGAFPQTLSEPQQLHVKQRAWSNQATWLRINLMSMIAAGDHVVSFGGSDQTDLCFSLGKFSYFENMFFSNHRFTQLSFAIFTFLRDYPRNSHIRPSAVPWPWHPWFALGHRWPPLRPRRTRSAGPSRIRRNVGHGPAATCRYRWPWCAWNPSGCPWLLELKGKETQKKRFWNVPKKYGKNREKVKASLWKKDSCSPWLVLKETEKAQTPSPNLRKDS